MERTLPAGVDAHISSRKSSRWVRPPRRLLRRTACHPAAVATTDTIKLICLLLPEVQIEESPVRFGPLIRSGYLLWLRFSIF